MDIVVFDFSARSITVSCTLIVNIILRSNCINLREDLIYLTFTYYLQIQPRLGL